MGQAAEPRARSISERDYRTYWTTRDPAGWLRVAQAEAERWLRDKVHVDLDLSADGEVSGHPRRAQVLHRSTSTEHGLRLRVWTTYQGVTYVTTLIAVENLRGDGGWAAIDCTSSNPYNRPAGKPALVDRLLDVVDFEDGGGSLGNHARIIRDCDVPELVQLISSRDRRLPLMVAGPFRDAPLERWRNHIDECTKRCHGVAHVAVLDPLAAEEFSQRLPELSPRTGTLRTLPPGLGSHDG